jgi:hypothetical protein
MTPPKKIYLGQNPTTGEPYDDWQKTRCESSDVAYFSEQAIREAALDMLNTSWADSNFDKAIEFLIKQLDKLSQ